MGVGMNEASKLVGTAVTASVAGRMLGGQIDADKAAGQRAQEENNKLTLENKQDVAEQGILSDTIEGAQADYNDALGDLKAAKELRPQAQSAEEGKWLDDQLYNSASTMAHSESEIQKAQEAFRVLQDKIDARNFMMQNNKKAIARAQR